MDGSFAVCKKDDCWEADFEECVGKGAISIFFHQHTGAKGGGTAAAFNINRPK